MHKLRVGVLMGGKSIEKEVSFNSGRTVCDHLDTSRYEVIPVYQTHTGTLYILPWQFLHRGKTSDFEHRLTHTESISWDALKERIDFMYIAVHGRYAEDGTLQGMLEILGIPYLGSKVLGSALGMDKKIQKQILAHNDIPVARGICIPASDIKQFENHKASIIARLTATGINLPCIVKPRFEGSSLGISIIHSHEELLPALEKACFAYPAKPQDVLIEEKIEGMEFSCITLTDYRTGNPILLPPTEIVPESGTHFFDYEQKYMPGRATKHTPPRCSDAIIAKIQATCLDAARALDIIDIARIDGFVTRDEKVIIVDPNTLSGMGPASFLFREAAEINMSHTQLINHLIETALHRYGMLERIEKAEQENQKNMLTHKLRVAVIMGGASNEREISLESGRNVYYKLSPQKYDATPLFLADDMHLYAIDQSLLVRNSTKEIAAHLSDAMRVSWSELPQKFDFVFIGLHGGAGENGEIQGALEMLGVPYNGSGVLTSALCMDKYKTNNFLRAQGFAVPQSYLVDCDEWTMNANTEIAAIHKTITYPMIVKPHDDGCSVMVQKVRTDAQLRSAIDTIFKNGKQQALVEECIIGMELTIGVIGNEHPRALPASQAVTAGDILSIEEKFLPGAGENQTPAPISAETMALVQRTMQEVYQAVDCKGYARIDCFYQNTQQSTTGSERIITIEINTLPGMTPATCIFHQAAELGIRPMDFIDMIIDYGLQEHRPHAAAAHEPLQQKNI